MLSAALSIFTSESRSVMILFSRSISDAISTINSWYNSTGAPSWAVSESASTFMDVSGVFSSCDTLETNSCRDSSNNFIFLSIALILADISSVSE